MIHTVPPLFQNQAKANYASIIDHHAVRSRFTNTHVEFLIYMQIKDGFAMVATLARPLSVVFEERASSLELPQSP